MALALFAMPASASNGLADGGFDSQGAGVSGYCYTGGQGCPSSPWSGGVVLIQSGNAAWGGLAAQSPSVLAAVQKNYSATQTFTATSSGEFRVVWYEADRPNAGGQTYNVLINGTVVATSISSTSSFIRKTSSSIFAMTAGQSYTITFQGTTTSGDHSALIDSVDILPAADVINYSYDALGRLVTASHGGAINQGVTATYTNDAADNRSNVSVTGVGH